MAGVVLGGIFVVTAGVIVAVLCMTGGLKACKCCGHPNPVPPHAPSGGDVPVSAAKNPTISGTYAAAPAHGAPDAGLGPDVVQPYPAVAASAPLRPGESAAYAQPAVH